MEGFDVGVRGIGGFACSDGFEDIGGVSDFLGYGCSDEVGESGTMRRVADKWAD